MHSLLVGSPALGFSLPDSEGRTRELHEFNDAGPLVLVFVTDVENWFARWHLRRLLRCYDALIERGTEVLVIAQAACEQLRRLRENNGLPFICLSDRDGFICARYGVSPRRRLTATVLIDSAGVIRYWHIERLLSSTTRHALLGFARRAQARSVAPPRFFRSA